MEFYFVIVEVNTDTDEERELWSGLDTRHILSKGDRILIRTALLAGVEYFLNENKPVQVFCCTHDSELPEKALSKHVLVAKQFESCGYTVHRMERLLGKDSWWMERQK